MFVYGIQTDVFQSGNQGNRARGIDTASVSVLLSSNASGSDKRKPLIHGEVESTALVFMKWLTEFDASFDTSCHVALLVDEAFWQSFMSFRNRICILKRTKVIEVPRKLTALMPMSNGMIKHLKINHHILSLEKRKVSNGLAADVALEDYLRLVPQAWTQVPVSTIVQSFKRFLPNSVCAGVINFKPLEDRLRVALKEAKVPNHILKYYLNQDKDIGPSDFLRNAILKIQSRHSFEQYLELWVLESWGRSCLQEADARA
ncbi:hypothetical protein BGZ58_010466 [Dissophora ornata]|nr:hypothetical protein BGZ58_010466 [Dissophora ornata]